MKTLEISTPLNDFSGEPLKNADGSVFTLKDALLVYLINAHQMNISRDDSAQLYAVGVKIGQGKESVELEQKEYDALKRMIDDGQITNPQQGQQGKPQALFGIVIHQQVKLIIDASPSVKEGAAE